MADGIVRLYKISGHINRYAPWSGLPGFRPTNPPIPMAQSTPGTAAKLRAWRASIRVPGGRSHGVASRVSAGRRAYTWRRCSYDSAAHNRQPFRARLHLHAPTFASPETRPAHPTPGTPRTSNMAYTPITDFPSFHLLCMAERDITAFEAAKEKYELPESVQIIYHNARLADLDPDVRFDAIVSPANSYGRMDGGFDDALSRAFSPKGDYLALTRVAQAAIYRDYRGLLPPGGCMLIKLEGEESLNQKNVWGCKYLAFCPTMKTPSDVTWDREIVHECMWSLLAAIDRHNREVQERMDQNPSDAARHKIQSVLMTPLATGCGLWSSEKWASQTVLAIKQFLAAAEDPARWKLMGPLQIMAHSMVVEKTYDL